MLEQFFAWYNGLTDGLWGSLLLFAVGVVLLIKGGDWFVDSAVGIAKKFKVPEIIIGATVVSIGTTLPEVMVSVTAAINNNGAIAYGNAIGSIICNTALIAALTIAIRPAPVDKKAIATPILFFFVSAAIYMIAAYIFGRFDRWLGIVMLLVFGAYMAMTIYKGFKNPVQHEEEEENAPSGSLVRDLIVLVISAALIAIGADMLEGSSVSLATMAGIPTEVVGVTVVALCTSLPELVTAVTALAKGHGALSLGNIIGANIFNLVLVSGAAVTISPFVIPEGSKLFGFNTSQLIEIPLMVAVMALMTLPTLFKGKLRRWQGITLLCIYVAFVVLQVLIALKVV
ncbi:MAG: calcium/sodium antiporter [Ruminococcaceae bacterium]|nr:calcium/sodium antiporter [Oscillospiraceae bacterium]